MVTEDFKIIISEDIKKCEDAINRGNKTEMNKLHGTLLSKYAKIIDGFDENLKNLFYDEHGQYVKQNLEIMRQKIVLFRAMEYTNSYSLDAGRSNITINNNMDVVLKITFSEAKNRVENMTGLKEKEIQEVLEKIDELESIINSAERKTKKWDNAKEIIKWMADKSVDVGLTLLPLLLKMNE